MLQFPLFISNGAPGHSGGAQPFSETGAVSAEDGQVSFAEHFADRPTAQDGAQDPDVNKNHAEHGGAGAERKDAAKDHAPGEPPPNDRQDLGHAEDPAREALETRRSADHPDASPSQRGFTMEDERSVKAGRDGVYRNDPLMRHPPGAQRFGPQEASALAPQHDPVDQAPLAVEGSAIGERQGDRAGLSQDRPDNAAKAAAEKTDARMVAAPHRIDSIDAASRSIDDERSGAARPVDVLDPGRHLPRSARKAGILAHIETAPSQRLAGGAVDQTGVGPVKQIRTGVRFSGSGQVANLPARNQPSAMPLADRPVAPRTTAAEVPVPLPKAAEPPEMAGMNAGSHTARMGRPAITPQKAGQSEGPHAGPRTIRAGDPTDRHPHLREPLAASPRRSSDTVPAPPTDRAPLPAASRVDPAPLPDGGALGRSPQNESASFKQPLPQLSSGALLQPGAKASAQPTGLQRAMHQDGNGRTLATAVVHGAAPADVAREAGAMSKARAFPLGDPDRRLDRPPLPGAEALARAPTPRPGPPTDAAGQDITAHAATRAGPRFGIGEDLHATVAAQRFAGAVEATARPPSQVTLDVAPRDGAAQSYLAQKEPSATLHVSGRASAVSDPATRQDFPAGPAPASPQPGPAVLLTGTKGTTPQTALPTQRAAAVQSSIRGAAVPSEPRDPNDAPVRAPESAPRTTRAGIAGVPGAASSNASAAPLMDASKHVGPTPTEAAAAESIVERPEDGDQRRDDGLAPQSRAEGRGAAPAAAAPGGMAHRPEAQAVLRQVAEAVARVQDDTVELRLNPEELGRVKLQMTPTESGLAVQISAERTETLDLLRRHADQLARDLIRAGYDAPGFTFSDQGRPGSGAHPAEPEPQSAAAVEDPRPKHTPTRMSGLDLRM